jgi:hypothetical protein
MVSLSLTISITRSGTDHVSAPPYSESLYNTRSRSDSQSYGYPIVKSNSLEHLLKPSITGVEGACLNGKKGQIMAGTGGVPMNSEPRKSYGIGGAGNIRMY